MSDDTTEALNRIANALELQALINRLHRLEEIVDEMDPREGEAYEAATRVLRHWAHRVDLLSGYKEER